MLRSKILFDKAVLLCIKEILYSSWYDGDRQNTKIIKIIKDRCWDDNAL